MGDDGPDARTPPREPDDPRQPGGRAMSGRGATLASDGRDRPDAALGAPLWRGGATRIAGVDEVGVAPTSGAVVAAAVIMSPNCHRIPGVRDSKTLSAGSA